MQVWNVLHAAGWKYRTQKIVKNRHLGNIAQLCLAISSQLRHVSTIEKKIVKQQYLCQVPQYGEIRPTNRWDPFGSLGQPSKFQWVLCLGFVLRSPIYWQRYCTALQQRRQPNFMALYKEWKYCTFADGATYIRLGGHHVGHRPHSR